MACLNKCAIGVVDVPEPSQNVLRGIPIACKPPPKHPDNASAFKRKLTEALIRLLTEPGKYGDGEVPGLYLEVRMSSKSAPPFQVLASKVSANKPHASHPLELVRSLTTVGIFEIGTWYRRQKLTTKRRASFVCPYRQETWSPPRTASLRASLYVRYHTPSKRRTWSKSSLQMNAW